MWIALLYAIMALATQFYRRSDDALPEPLGQDKFITDNFQRRTVQCLILADYTSLVPFTLEAMLVYLYGEYYQSPDAQPGIFVTMGMVVRLALRMGYHRDPSHSGSIPPFQAEMRRRVWTLVCHTDMLFCSQNGLPSFIRAEQCDTQQPRNLMDGDLQPDMTELPPARPLTEATPVSFLIAKDSVVRVARRIVEHLAMVSPTPYDAVLDLHHQLQEARDTIPPQLRMRSMDRSVTDSSELIMERFLLDFSYQNARCRLHRPYLMVSRSEVAYAFSRKHCVEAALLLLDHQSTLHEEIHPAGQLHGLSWFLTSFATNAFLTAAMAICLEISRDHVDNTASQGHRLVAALVTSHKIWCASRAKSSEARKAADALAIMLRIARERDRWRASRTASVSQDASDSNSESDWHFTATLDSDDVNGVTLDTSSPQDTSRMADTELTWEELLRVPPELDVDWVSSIFGSCCVPCTPDPNLARAPGSNNSGNTCSFLQL